jgi:hypothetical protein
MKVGLGYDWSLICEGNKFSAGDVVRFKFAQIIGAMFSKVGTFE